MSNPNAVVAALTTAITTAIFYLLSRYGHTQLSTYWQGIVTGGVASAVLFIGRDGIKGAFSDLWRGSKAVWGGKGKGGSTPTPTPTPPAPPAPPVTP